MQNNHCYRVTTQLQFIIIIIIITITITIRTATVVQASEIGVKQT